MLTRTTLKFRQHTLLSWLLFISSGTELVHSSIKSHRRADDYSVYVILPKISTPAHVPQSVSYILAISLDRDHQIPYPTNQI